MALDANCACSPDAVDLAFRESEPFIEREIRDRSYEMRRYLVDYAPVKIFPDGVGYELTKVRFFGDIGPQYDGFDGWRKEQRSRPFASGHKDAHDACGYVWEEVGHGFEQLHFHLMKRDLKTVPICVHDIRTFWEFQQYQNLIFKNLAEITANMREQLNRNAIIGFSVKHVVTSKGLEINSANPYELPNITGVTVGKLNFRILKRLYNALLREAGAFALDTMNGRPVFGLMASDDVLDDMFYEDDDIRTDIRESSMVDSLLTRYNFAEGVRNMFINIPDMFAPRYRDDGNGNLIRVFPYERDVAIESGTRPAPNPDYENAPYELVLILTRDLFTLRSRQAITTVGGETDFDAEAGMFDWKWHNPPRWCDPNRRIGFYYANGNIGIEPGDFTDIPGILVRRRPAYLDAAFWPAATCPPDPIDCNNELAVQGCPEAQIVDCCPLFDDPNSLQFKFSSPLAGPPVATDPIAIKLENGGVAQGTITSIAGDALSAEVDFGEPVECCPGTYLYVETGALGAACSADVITDKDGTAADRRLLQLEGLLIMSDLTGTTAVEVQFEDGSWGTADVIAIDTDAITYEVDTIVGNPNGLCITKVCLPTADFAQCPACNPTAVTCDPVTGLP